MAVNVDLRTFKNVTNDQTAYDVKLDAPQSITQQLVIKQIDLTESILVPSLQTTVRFQDVIHTDPVKNLDVLKNTDIEVHLYKDINKAFPGTQTTMDVYQRFYRLDNRALTHSRDIEEWNAQACDPSLLDNARKRVSKSWQCTSPSNIVRDVLSKCLNVPRMHVEQSGPNRTYFAENIHPFQVIAQMGDVALAGGDDPSFLHYMTYEQRGTHNFRSLKELTAQSPVYEYMYGETNHNDPHNILAYEFPCDFDYLSDIMNTVGSSVSVFSINSWSGERKLTGNATQDGCGMGGALATEVFTNAGNAEDCPLEVEKYAERRQARLALLEQDKIALRMVVPWNPGIHVGNMIRVTFPNVTRSGDGGVKWEKDYGSGDYLVTTMTHTVMYGGYAQTTLDCVAKSVGQGIV